MADGGGYPDSTAQGMTRTDSSGSLTGGKPRRSLKSKLPTFKRSSSRSDLTAGTTLEPERKPLDLNSREQIDKMMNDQWELASNTSVSSKVSTTSLASRAGSAAAAMKRKLSIGSLRRQAKTTAVPAFTAGDQCDTVSFMKVTLLESTQSDEVGSLPDGAYVEILEVSAEDARRAKIVSAVGIQGWISVLSVNNKPAIKKRSEHFLNTLASFEVGQKLEVKSAATVRVEEEITSEAKAIIRPGTQVQILEFSSMDRRRAKVCAQAAEGMGVTGWMSVTTKEGDPIIGTIPPGSRNKGAVEFEQKFLKVKNVLEASALGDMVAIKKVLEDPESERQNLVNSCDIHGKTALMYAASFGNKAVVEYLCTNKGLDVNLLDDTQKNCLHHAAKRCLAHFGAEMNPARSDIAALLIHSSVCIESRDRNGCTPIMFAAANGDSAMTQTLIEAQANVDVKDYEGKSPLDYAINFGHEGFDKILGLETADTEVAVACSTVESEAARGEAPAKDTVKAKAKAKAKGKKAPRKATISAGMLEALEGDGEAQESALAPEVTVGVDTEEGDDKQRALAKMNALMAASCTAADLSAAIQTAWAAGAEESEILEAEKRVKELKSKGKVQEKLQQAIAERDVRRLRKAIAKAEEAKVSGAKLEEAIAVLADEELKQAALEKLQAAADSGNMEELKAALAEAKKTSLDGSELAEFTAVLACAESKQNVETVLRREIEDGSVTSLKFAIQQAKDAGVDKELIKQAKAALSRQKAREQLRKACEAGTIDVLKEALSAAEAANLEASDCEDALALLRQEEEKLLKLAVVSAVMEEVKNVDTTSIEALREAREKLNNTIQEAISTGVAEGELTDAESRRKKLHNLIEDLKGSIRVFCRVRPLSKKETEQGDTQVTNGLNSMSLEVGSERFSFDAVFTPGTQEEVFNDCRDLVQSAVDGFNVTIFAYGQTGAGKTFTMYGAPGMEGAAPRIIQEVFRVTDLGKSRFNYTVMGSMLELYRNDFVDLLQKGMPGTSKVKLNVKQEGGKSGAVFVEHLTEEECRSAEELSAVLERGNKQRTVAATAMNSESSRSHLVLCIKIVSVNRETKEMLRGKILLCDLAGSERLKKSLVTDEMQKEAIEINKSLTALGDVIEALTKGQKMIPYRNHKLTQLMQDSLGGSSKTLMFVNCSPASSNLDETIMSLKYATRAKSIQNSAKKNTN